MNVKVADRDDRERVQDDPLCWIGQVKLSLTKGELLFLLERGFVSTEVNRTIYTVSAPPIVGESFVVDYDKSPSVSTYHMKR